MRPGAAIARRLAVAAVALWAAGVAQGQTVDCATAQTQRDINACAAVELSRVDAALNAVYAEARTAMRQRDAAQSPDQTGAEIALRDAQRAWISFRDLACAAEGFLVRGGSIEPLVVLTCKTRLTETRIHDLRGLARNMSR